MTDYLSENEQWARERQQVASGKYPRPVRLLILGAGAVASWLFVAYAAYRFYCG